MSEFKLPEGNVHLTLSGGRSSAYLLHRVLQSNNGLPDRAKIVFANTGREDPRTLEFVRDISLFWGVPIIWVEYSPIKPWFKVVDFETAARDGEPFEEMVKHKRFTPNGGKRICTEQLKVRAARRMLVSLGWKNWTKSIGIRFDEPARHGQKPQPREALWSPLIDAGVTKSEVMAFWKSHKFDLAEGVESNCRLCFQFGLDQLRRQMLERPEDLFPERIEALGFGTFKGAPWSEVRRVVLSGGQDKDFRKRKRICGASENEECQ